MNEQTPAPRGPVVLCILDGWGERAETDHNAIALARTPTWDRLVADAPKARLDASAEAVGLPAGQMGNSEVGHMNIGAGRVVPQDLPRIDAAIADGSLAADPELAAFTDRLRRSGGACHLMGLMSPGGVHAHQDHIAVLASLVAAAGVPVRVHAFLDGRDTPPSSAERYLGEFLAGVADIEGVSVATVSGRYYAMDRDANWERTERAYRAVVAGDGETADDALAAIAHSYDVGATDEFVAPTVIGGYAGMADGDGVLCANFRADRARQILGTLADPEFAGFARTRTCTLVARLGMVEYSEDLNAYYRSIFKPLELQGILGQVVADAGLRQLRVAETEKYAHVTFFLNGGREREFDGEHRILVPSPKVATYDLQPEMSAPSVTDAVCEAVDEGGFDLIVVNYANGDMVGHTGVLTAAIAAAEAVDASLARLEKAVAAAGGVMMVTADHGNCEMMLDANAGQAHTAHTTNLVPIVMVNPPNWVAGLRDGCLSDIAPTVLRLMDIECPADMTGRSLIEETTAETVAAQ